MDVDGVGYATIISNILSSSLCIIALRRSILQFRFRKMRFDIREMKDILHLGIPTGLQSACYALANVVITTAVNGFGPDATTGISIANQIDGVLYQISYAPSLAISPYIAQNVGAHNIDRVKKSLVRSIGITIAFGGGLGALSSIFSAELASLMTSSPAVITFACQKIMLVSATYFICGINEVLSGALRGLGKPVVPTISTLVFMCLLRFVWVYAIFPLFPNNLTFLYLVWPVGWVLSIALLLAVYFPTISKLQKQLAL
jgi:Na+-driven multidrug efflux pump